MSVDHSLDTPAKFRPTHRLCCLTTRLLNSRPVWPRPSARLRCQDAACRAAVTAEPLTKLKEGFLSVSKICNLEGCPKAAPRLGPAQTAGLSQSVGCRAKVMRQVRAAGTVQRYSDPTAVLSSAERKPEEAIAGGCRAKVRRLR